MALSQEHRRSITRSLVPVLGEEEALAFVNSFPLRDDGSSSPSGGSAPVAAHRADLATSRVDVLAKISDLQIDLIRLRGELMTLIAEVRGEMRTEFARRPPVDGR